MYPTIRRTARAYLDRRTPWGPPWWVVAVALGAANLIRQAFLWRTDPATTVSLVTFVAMVAIVVGAVTGLHRLVGGRPHGPGRDLGGHEHGRADGPEQLALWDAGPTGDRADRVACR